MEEIKDINWKSEFLKSPMGILIIVLLLSLGYRVLDDATDNLSIIDDSGITQTVNIRSIGTNLTWKSEDLDKLLKSLGHEGLAALDFENNNYMLDFSLVENGPLSEVLCSIYIRKNVNDEFEYIYYGNPEIMNSSETKQDNKTIGSITTYMLGETTQQRLIRTLHLNNNSKFFLRIVPYNFTGVEKLNEASSES